jgi:hypothetical protein
MSKEHGENEKMPCQRSMSKKKGKRIAQSSQKLCDRRGVE